MKNIAVLIPAYKPDRRLNGLIGDLREKGFGKIVVVDDGSGARYAPFFNEAWLQGARVLYHDANRGKGAALKTGLNWLNLTGARGVVTCDADGQHTSEDVMKVAMELEAAPDTLVLGVRDTGKMPPRSRVGNCLTRMLFGLKCGLWVRDTQTGLRGIPEKMLSLMTRIEGQRYEYEMNVLVFAKRKGVEIIQVPIETIYFDNNARTSFQPFRDGFKIYAELLRPQVKKRAS